MLNEMKKIISILYIIVSLNVCYSQEVISTQGDHFSNSTGSVSYTIGEVITNTVSNGTNDITQGFHQSKWKLTGILDFASDIEVLVYPNPMEQVLNIKTLTFDGIHFELYDAQGKLIKQDHLIAEQTSINVEQLAPGSYSLNLLSESNPIKVFKLIKQY